MIAAHAAIMLFPGVMSYIGSPTKHDLLSPYLPSAVYVDDSEPETVMPSGPLQAESGSPGLTSFRRDFAETGTAAKQQDLNLITNS